jgi:transposase-like protein
MKAPSAARKRTGTRASAAQRPSVNKSIAFTLVERDGRARSFHVANVSGKTLRPLIVEHVRRSSTLMTDDAGQYRPIGAEFARFETVNHGADEYVRGDAHSNTVEGYFSILKRGVIGTPQHQRGPPSSLPRGI